MENQYAPHVIIFSERKKFHAASKRDDETVVNWYARVKRLAIHCKFGANLEPFCVDKFVCGMSGKLFERLCEEDEKITLAEALKKALLAETRIIMRKAITVDDEIEVNFVRRRDQPRSKSKSNGSSATGKPKKPCKRCGWRNHATESCRFKDSKCHSCVVKGHLASVCNKNKSKNINFVDNENDEVDVVVLAILIGILLNFRRNATVQALWIKGFQYFRSSSMKRR